MATECRRHNQFQKRDEWHQTVVASQQVKHTVQLQQTLVKLFKQDFFLIQLQRRCQLAAYSNCSTTRVCHWNYSYGYFHYLRLISFWRSAKSTIWWFNEKEGKNLLPLGDSKVPWNSLFINPLLIHSNTVHLIFQFCKTNSWWIVLQWLEYHSSRLSITDSALFALVKGRQCTMDWHARVS